MTSVGLGGLPPHGSPSSSTSAASSSPSGIAPGPGRRKLHLSESEADASSTSSAQQQLDNVSLDELRSASQAEDNPCKFFFFFLILFSGVVGGSCLQVCFDCNVV